jgi:Na+/proline symporter
MNPVVIILILYFSLMLLIGFWSGRKIKDTTDFLIAGRRLGLVLATATMFATWFGGESVIGTAGTVYKQGLYGIISDPFGASLALILAGLFYAPALRRLNLLTVTDIFEKSYSRELEILATILMIPVFIAWLGAQIVATGLTFSTFTNIDPNLGMLIGGGVIVIYTLCGGMWAVTLTDFVQMLILILGIITILPFVLTDAGGIKNVISSTPKEFFIIFPQTKDLPTWLTYFGKWAMLGLGCVVGQDLIQRSLSSRTESIARWSSVLAGIIYFLMGLVIISIGLSARFVITNLEYSEMLIPTLANKYLSGIHQSLFSLFICGLLAAIMSSADSSLLAATSLFTNNLIIKSYPKVSQKTFLLINRVATVVITFLAVMIALYVKQVYNLMVNSCVTLLVSLFVPTSAALFFKKFVNKTSCWCSMLGGFIVWIGYIFFTTGKFVINDETMNVFYQAASLGFLTSLIMYLLPIVLFKSYARKTC